jgi:hypothetical protein
LRGRCQAIKPNGDRCNAPVQGVSDWCYNHNPTLAEERRRNAAKAGRSSARARRMRATEELTRLKEVFERLADRVLKGEVDRADAAIAGQLINYARACIKDMLIAREQDELEQRMSAIEEALERSKPRTPTRHRV